jgi:hypothetical protein
MKTNKLYYLECLKHIGEENWSAMSGHFSNMERRERRIVPNDGVDAKGNKIRKNSSIGPGVVGSGSGSSLSLGTQITRGYSVCGGLPSATPVPVPVPGSCAVYVTTKDAYTLTDGPTIFLANNIEKIAKFCIQQAAIPAAMMEDIMSKIEFNNSVNTKTAILEKEMEDVQERMENKNADNNGKASSSSGKKTDHKINRDLEETDGTYKSKSSDKSDVKRIIDQLTMLRSMIKPAKLHDNFVPNSKDHLDKWGPARESNAFTSNIEEETILQIMMLDDVENSWKVLLLMGIGVFTNHKSIAYTEIMKKLADEQRLFIIIASSDYIYGTNYQFCHGFIGKDLTHMTQQKTLQAMGRIGRNNIQQDYTIRFRDNEQIIKLFSAEIEKPEIKNMNKLFCSL